MLDLKAFFDRDVVSVAEALIGSLLFVDGVGGVIVETEAYRHDDPASHSFKGATARNAAMFGQAGTAYVYRSHGLHWCFNIVCQAGNAVLIRALEPVMGISIMKQRRCMTSLKLLCAGPGRLAQALGIDHSFNGRGLDEAPLELALQKRARAIKGPRIGISKAVDRPWRFGLPGSPYIGRPFKTQISEDRY